MKEENIDWKEIYSKKKKALLSTVLAVVAIFGGLILWNTLQAEIVLVVPHRGSTVYLDESEQYLTREDNQEMTFKVSRGAHSVLVAHDGTWPWAKEISLAYGEEERLHAFNLPNTRESQQLPSADPLYGELQGSIDGEPMKINTSDDGTVKIVTDGRVITATWVGDSDKRPSAFCLDGCSDIITVFNSDSEIGDIAFMGTRNDVVVFASGGNINAIEINREGTQNVQPLYVGTSPEILRVSKAGVYFHDRGAIRFTSFLPTR